MINENLTCPFCGSDCIYFSRKYNIYICEECNKRFSEASDKKPNVEQSENKQRLFFSYGHDRATSEIVSRVKKDLEARGHQVWIDTTKIKPGDHWRDDIVKGIVNSSNIIAFLSEHSTRNPGVCLDELKIAICVKGLNVKTVLVEPERKIQPPSTLSDIQWVDMSDWYEVKRSDETVFDEWYKEKFRELCEAIESDDTLVLDGDINFLKRKLSPNLNTDKEHELLRKDFYGREWLNNYISDWKKDSLSKVLVIYGKPGSGKSAYCVNYSHYNADVYGCFLCEWNRTQTTNPCDMIRTIAFKLATKLPDYRVMLVNLLKDAAPNLNEMKPEELFNYLLSTPLNHSIDGNRATGMIIVDGLDEAEIYGENPLVRVFYMCVQKLPHWIKVIFTSRPEPSVKEHLQSFQHVDIIEDMPDDYNDILLFLMNALKEEIAGSEKNLDIVRHICDLSEGVFQYAAFLVEEIRSKAISLLEANTFPKGLNAFYLCSMERKFKTKEVFEKIRSFLEILCVADSMPEPIIRDVCGLGTYEYLSHLGKMGAWIVVLNTKEANMVSFCHKSVRDWLTNPAQSGRFFVDSKNGALVLARYCRNHLDEEYAREHIGDLYVKAGEFAELEQFLIENKDELYPFWKIWFSFPKDWNHNNLLSAFWTSKSRNGFFSRLLREGDMDFLRWIIEKAKNNYGIETFDRELVTLYIEIVHLSGGCSDAVDIINEYQKKYTLEQIINDEYLLMQRIRKIHHETYYVHAGKLLEEAMQLFRRINNKFPSAYNELLFLIGGKLGILLGDWMLSKEWIDRSERFAEEKGLEDIHRRNARKLSDYYCHEGNLGEAENVLLEYIPKSNGIKARYEAYLVGALGNVYTCMDKDKAALDCYNRLLDYTSMKGLSGWMANAYLGLANVNYKLNKIQVALDYASQANQIYIRIQETWGLVMSDTMMAACKSKLGTAPIRIACSKALNLAKKMEYGGCVSSIEDLCSGKCDYLKLYFL